MAVPVLYMIGAVALLCPMGLNPQDVVEEFGGDFAVKPLVGAPQSREFVGPADTRLTLSGKIFPFRFGAAGGSSGQAEIAALKGYAASGQPQPVTRGDGLPMGFYVIEKGQLKHARLSVYGIGREQDFTLQLVQVPSGPSPTQAISLYTGLTDALTALAGTALSGLIP